MLSLTDSVLASAYPVGLHVVASSPLSPGDSSQQGERNAPKVNPTVHRPTGSCGSTPCCFVIGMETFLGCLDIKDESRTRWLHVK